MKKIVAGVLIIASFVVACGGGTDVPAGGAEEAPAKVSLSDNPDYKKGLALVAQNNCMGCHEVEKQLAGPAYRDVAARYANADEATIEKLAKHIIEGGSGNWGDIPMLPHPDVSLEDAKAMVKYVLLLKKD